MSSPIQVGIVEYSQSVKDKYSLSSFQWCITCEAADKIFLDHILGETFKSNLHAFFC